VPSTTPRTSDLIRHGSPEFRRTTLALFAAGFSTFALLYCVQPLMPVFAREFHVSGAESSLPLSLTTGFLAPALIVAGTFSEARGRVPLMLSSLLAAALLTIACALAPRWGVLLALRALAGISFAGLPAISMAYLSEEVHPNSIGLAMGLAIGGNGLGGMSGRLLTALIADLLSWRWAMAVIGALGVAATIVAWRTLPPSRHFKPHPLRIGALSFTFWEQLCDARLVPLYCEGFLLGGAFVATYNYVTYHLLAEPYSLSHAAVGFIFVVYLVGIVASAWIGSVADRAGRPLILASMALLMLAGIALTTLRPLALVIAGVAVVTFGFFGGHSVASSWVGLRATHAKAQAAALYLFFYYLGSSVVGSMGGLFWDRWRWPGVASFVAALSVTSFVVALGLTRSPAPATAAAI
jgi:MFS transporter, YNFM family, putative membrane transport protein